MRIGMGLADRIFVVAMVTFFLLAPLLVIPTFEGATTTSQRLLALGPLFIVLVFALTFVLVRAIGRNDRATLYEVIVTALEARAVDLPSFS